MDRAFCNQTNNFAKFCQQNWPDSAADEGYIITNPYNSQCYSILVTAYDIGYVSIRFTDSELTMKNETNLITPQTSVPCICFHVGQSSHWHLYLATIRKAADFHEMMHAVMLSYQSRKYNQQHEHHEHEYKQLSSLESRNVTKTIYEVNQ